MKVQSPFLSRADLQCRGQSRRKEGMSLPHIPALLSSHGGGGRCAGGSLSLALTRRPTRRPGISRAREGPPARCLWESRQALTNPLQFAPTNPACSLGSRKPFFMQSCAQLCLRETDLAGCP